MEILAVVEYTFWRWFIIVVLSILTLLFTVLIITGIVSEIKDGFSFDGVMALVICLLLSLLFGVATYSAYNDDSYVEYKVVITDFNEVFQNGYEIVSNEGEIYTLKKAE